MQTETQNWHRIMRNTMIVRAFCSDCGGELLFPYAQEAKVAKPDAHRNGDPTGALVHYMPVFVSPCRTCIESATGPARKLTEAVREMAAGKVS